jgi:hypothetical protein
MALLLTAEVIAATAVVSESVLVYVARHRNLLLSLTMLAVQAVLSIIFIYLFRHFGYGPLFQAAGVALALCFSLAFASVTKAILLSKLLGAVINGWRWALFWALAAAVPIGWAATEFLPEWAELAFGIPAILGVYGLVIWHRGFGEDDRALFRKQQSPSAE